MALSPENPLRFPYLFDANVALKAKNYDVAVDLMEKLVRAAGKSRGQLTPSELRLFPIVFKSRVDSLRFPEGERLMEKSNKAKLVDVCLRILNLLDSILIPSADSKIESEALYLTMKKECYWYLAEARDVTRRKKPMTRRVWCI